MTIEQTPATLSRLLALAAALRSGEFVQGHEGLRLPGHGPRGETTLHCCLGVGCELRRREDPSEGHWDGEYFVTRSGSDLRTSRAFFPSTVVPFYGVDSAGSVVVQESDLSDELARKLRDNVRGSGRFAVKLYQLNDDHFSFGEIAEVIEAHVKRAAREIGLGETPAADPALVLTFAPVAMPKDVAAIFVSGDQRSGVQNVFEDAPPHVRNTCRAAVTGDNTDEYFFESMSARDEALPLVASVYAPPLQ